jgi:hypothetical protein
MIVGLATLAIRMTASARANCLYRFYGDDDALLYIGMTKNPLSRLNDHARGKDWFGEVVRVSIEHFPSRYELQEAEKRAICSENPAFNIAYLKRSTPPAPRWDEPPPHMRWTEAEWDEYSSKEGWPILKVSDLAAYILYGETIG